MLIIEHNVETGEIIEREMKPNEIENLEKVQLEAVDKLTRKQDAKAKLLERLGITEEEAALLLA